jgi:hypothetical protein
VHINRIKGLLFAQGIRGIKVKSQCKTLAVDKLLTGDGHRLPPRLACEIARELLAMVQKQIAEIEHERDTAPTPCEATERRTPVVGAEESLRRGRTKENTEAKKKAACVLRSWQTIRLE